jgi:ABC-type transport system involved in multi-copper enzyme maturation permease subunit
MFWKIVKKECLEHILSLRFTLACLICFAVVITSISVKVKEFYQDVLDYQTNVGLHQAQAGQHKIPWTYFYEGVTVDKPLNPLQVFFRGLKGEILTTVKVSPWEGANLELSPERNPVKQLFPFADLTFFIGVIMSLLAIFFAYDSISGEREKGTLKLVMSYSLPKDIFLLAKWLGGYIVLILPFLLAVISALIIACLSPYFRLSGQDWLSLAIILLVGFIYLACIYSLGIFVSVKAKLSATAVTILLFVWVGLVLVIPNVSPYLATQFSKTPSLSQVEKGIREALAGRWGISLDKEMEEIRKKTMSGQIKIKEAEQKMDKLIKTSTLKALAQEEKIIDNFRKKQAEIVNLAKKIALLSPFSCFLYTATELAGVGLIEENKFFNAIKKYRHELVKYGHTKPIVKILHADKDSYSIRCYSEKADFSDLPKFTYKPTSIKERVSGVFLEIGVLSILTIIFFMLAYLSFIKGEVK